MLKIVEQKGFKYTQSLKRYEFAIGGKQVKNPYSLDVNMNVLITGAAGFIGFSLSKELLKLGTRVVGIDNLNDYYDVDLKLARLELLKKYCNFEFIKGNIADAAVVDQLFAQCRPAIVVNLAAQAGVRYSLINPQSYIESNIVGFFNILEACRHYPVEHLLYASSSSVYGNQRKTPFSVKDDVSKPASLYAATKKSDELMAYTYSHLYDIPTTGLRFFTVYGPFGRPDMAYFSFTQKMLSGETIQVFNYGDLKRDFTYIDDIVEGVKNILCSPPQGKDPARVYNIGNNKPEKLLLFIETLESCLMEVGLLTQPASKEFLPMQPGDVYQTYADITDLICDSEFKPSTPLNMGLMKFAEWYKIFYQK